MSQQRSTQTSTRRTHQPVRRFSKHAGTEGTFWRPFDPRDISRTMLAAERYERTQRKRGERNGPLGPVGLEVLRELLRLVDYRSGRLDPAIVTLMQRLKRSKDAIVRALAALRRAGFLDWLRRWKSVEQPDAFGPQVVQTTNAYRLLLPPIAQRLLGHLASAPPVPDDVLQAKADTGAAIEESIRRLPPGEQPRARLGAGPLTDTLEGLFAAMKKGSTT